LNGGELVDDPEETVSLKERDDKSKTTKKKEDGRREMVLNGEKEEGRDKMPLIN